MSSYSLAAMSFRNRIIIAACFLCALPVGVFADDSPSLGSQTPRRSALLLKSGRVIEGHISESDSHIVVQRSGVRVQVPKADIEFVGDDPDAVYRYKARAVADEDVEGHIRLAEWCLQVNLYDGAIEQLEIAGESRPQTARVQALLDTAHRSARNAGRRVETPSTAAPDSGSARVHAAYQHEVAAPLLSNFSVQIQPMLTRTCATAGCHDSAHTGPLVLQRSPRAVAKLTQQNLRSVLGQLDLDEPDSSPLLAFAVRPHGRAASPLAKGASDPAFITLVEWVRAVSRKGPAKPAEPARIPDELSANAEKLPEQPVPVKPTAIEPASATLEREIGHVRAKLEEIAGNGRVHSNRPLAPTPSRIRAGMIPTAPGSTAMKNAPPPITEGQSAPTIRPATTPASGGEPAKPANVTAPAPQDRRPIANTAGPIAGSGRYDPVDPFDPEVFNRQWGPRPK
jgi:hypothetical protein